MTKEYYIKVPTWIARSPSISPLAKTLFVVISSYNPSFPSYKTLILNTGIKSKTTIRKCLIELLSFNLISIKKGGFNTSNTYVINSSPINELSLQKMKLDIPNNELKRCHQMDSIKNNIKISNKENNISVFSPEISLQTHLTVEEVSKQASMILKEIKS